MKCKVVKKEYITQEYEKVYDISVEKYNNFILSNGTVVHNCDTYARSGVEQDLLHKGYNFSIISVDRVNNNVCEPYAYFKNCIYEKRISLPRKGVNLLTEELVGLKRNNNNGHVDHDPSGINSKDAADSICGALWNASKNAEEFAFDFGESLSNIVEANNDDDFQVDFQNKFTESLKVQPSYVRNDQRTFDVGGLSVDILDGILNW